MILIFIVVFLAAMWGARLGTREALKQFKEEVIREMYEKKPNSLRRSARDALEIFKSELLQELKGDTPLENKE